MAQLKHMRPCLIFYELIQHPKPYYPIDQKRLFAVYSYIFQTNIKSHKLATMSMKIQCMKKSFHYLTYFQPILFSALCLLKSFYRYRAKNLYMKFYLSSHNYLQLANYYFYQKILHTNELY